MTTLLPQDANDHPIPALRLKDGAAHTVPATATSARNTVAFDDATRIISIYTDVPVFLKFGDAAVTATNADHFFPAGTYYDISIGGDKAGHYTNLAALRAGTTDGTPYISEKE